MKVSNFSSVVYVPPTPIFLLIIYLDQIQQELQVIIIIALVEIYLNGSIFYIKLNLHLTKFLLNGIIKIKIHV